MNSWIPPAKPNQEQQWLERAAEGTAGWDLLRHGLRQARRRVILPCPARDRG